jgi:hypothetical protein
MDEKIAGLLTKGTRYTRLEPAHYTLVTEQMLAVNKCRQIRKCQQTNWAHQIAFGKNLWQILYVTLSNFRHGQRLYKVEENPVRC